MNKILPGGPQALSAATKGVGGSEGGYKQERRRVVSHVFKNILKEERVDPDLMERWGSFYIEEQGMKSRVE